MSSAPRVRVVALAAGLAVLALGAGFFVLTRGQESSTAAPQLSAQALVKRAAAKRKAAGKTAPKSKPSAPKHTLAPTPKRAPKPVETNGLPSSIASALERQEVVVVTLYAPDVPLDDMALREARAGAASVGAGFVALNVLNESQSKPLTELLGLLEDPAVLVFRRPDKLVLRISGYADQQSVAQAARNAAL